MDDLNLGATAAEVVSYPFLEKLNSLNVSETEQRSILHYNRHHMRFLGNYFDF
jgi:hypothetical protein